MTVTTQLSSEKENMKQNEDRDFELMHLKDEYETSMLMMHKIMNHLTSLLTEEYEKNVRDTLRKYEYSGNN